jgi:predicted permease
VRAAELATRAALGAGRWRLVRAVLAEAMVLWGSATALGIGLAFGGAPLVRAWIPPEAPRVSTIAIDLRVLALTIAAALVTSLVCGLWPALASSRPDLQLTLRAAGRSGASTVGQRLRSILVVAEIALAVVLLVGAGLFIFSFARLTAIEPGFDYRHLLVLNVGVTVQPGRLDDALKQGLPYLQRVSDVIRATPGVQDVALVNGGLPLSGGFSRTRVSLPGGPELSGDDAVIDRRSVSPGYLTLLRVPLRRGRHLSDADRETSEQVAVVNETAARRYWPGRDPIGQRLLINAVERTIVGVVGDIRHLGPEAPPRPEAYVPLAQDPVTGATVVARAVDPLAILPSVRSAIWSVNPRQRLLEDTVTLEAYMNRLVAQRRFNMALLSLFGVLGLFIAALGLYSLMAYTVAQRTSEIGLRMALGATRSQIVGGVLGRSASLLGLGLCLGGVGVWALRASVGAFLFETTPGDPGVLAVAVSVLIAVGLLATAVPAMRASRVDPAIALRNE